MKHFIVKKSIWLATIVFLVPLTSCYLQQKISAPQVCTSGAVVSAPNLMDLQISDDLDIESMQDGLSKSVLYWQKQPANREVEFCGQQYSSRQMLESIELFREILRSVTRGELTRVITDNFNICQAGGDGGVLVTGYYQPVLKGSIKRRPPYIYPLYGIPKDLKVIKSENRLPGKAKIGRLVDGKLLPYWSRADIENKKILQGQEVAFLADPVQAFFLHVQGSGLLQFVDGSSRAILFAGSNGRKYSSIGRLLADEGRIPLEVMSMPKIKAYLNEHLDEQKRILHYNERYIFFRWGDPDGSPAVIGSMGEELTAGRSVALDQKCYPFGIPALLDTKMPRFDNGTIIDWQSLKRFVLNQDSGSAIKGPRRVDLFWGHGLGAERVAGVMKQPGKLYFFVKKKL